MTIHAARAVACALFLLTLQHGAQARVVGFGRAVPLGQRGGRHAKPGDDLPVAAIGLYTRF